MVAEIKDFDFKQCPFCGYAFDMHKDFSRDDQLRYRHCIYVFRCHGCGTLYEALPVNKFFKHLKLLLPIN